MKNNRKNKTILGAGKNPQAHPKLLNSSKQGEANCIDNCLVFTND